MRILTLTACEAEVMTVIWSKRAVTVQDVVDTLPRQLAYTTVMTTMKILAEKGYIARGEKRGRAYVYRPLVSCESATGNTVTEMANRFFDGSVKSMVLSLIKAKQISTENLAELRDAIDSLEQANCCDAVLHENSSRTTASQQLPAQEVVSNRKASSI